MDVLDMTKQMFLIIIILRFYFRIIIQHHLICISTKECHFELQNLPASLQLHILVLPNNVSVN